MHSKRKQIKALEDRLARLRLANSENRLRFICTELALGHTLVKVAFTMLRLGNCAAAKRNCDHVALALAHIQVELRSFVPPLNEVVIQSLWEKYNALESGLRDLRIVVAGSGDTVTESSA